MTCEMPADWVTRDGRVIPIAQMGDRHLRNAIAMMRRNGRITPDEVVSPDIGGPPQGEMAYDAWEQALGQSFEEAFNSRVRASPHLAALEAELRRREARAKGKGSRLLEALRRLTRK